MKHNTLISAQRCGSAPCHNLRERCFLIRFDNSFLGLVLNHRVWHDLCLMRRSYGLATALDAYPKSTLKTLGSLPTLI